jgi:hypothetical protein
MTASCDDLPCTTVANNRDGVSPKEKRRYGSRKNHKIIYIPIPKLAGWTIPGWENRIWDVQDDLSQNKALAIRAGPQEGYERGNPMTGTINFK